LIIDHGEGYHSLLAGLGRIDAAVGQKLLAGEPIGIMPRTAKGTLRLYMELRRDGRPIDPLPWLEAPPNSKVSG
jgi:septal ring factor EnvC (AmiA/AmiB activator)